MRHDPTVAGLLLSLAYDLERYAEKCGEPRRQDDLLADQRRYLEGVVSDTDIPTEEAPRSVSQARGRDERH